MLLVADNLLLVCGLGLWVFGGVCVDFLCLIVLDVVSL